MKQATRRAGELAEMRNILRMHGYDEKDAARLQAEGMGSMELAHRIKSAGYTGLGSLEYTHGMTRSPFRRFVYQWNRLGLPGKPVEVRGGKARVRLPTWGVEATYDAERAARVMTHFGTASGRSDDGSETIAESFGAAGVVTASKRIGRTRESRP